MARKLRGPQAGIAQAIKPVSAKAQKGPKKDKRLNPKKGDFVTLGSRMHQHMLGSLLKVTDIVDDKRVICEGVAPNDTDYMGLQIVVFTRRPKGQTEGGDDKANWLPWIGDIINVKERIVYKEVEVKPKRVVTSQEELQEVLTADTSGEHVVVQLPTAQSNHPSAHRP